MGWLNVLTGMHFLVLPIAFIVWGFSLFELVRGQPEHTLYIASVDSLLLVADIASMHFIEIVRESTQHAVQLSERRISDQV